MLNTEFKQKKPYQYSFELESIFAEFAAMINGAVCIRYDYDNEKDERIFKETVTPYVIFGPKHRVLHSLINQAKIHAYPLVTCRVTGIDGNSDRIAAKHLAITRYNGEQLYSYDRPTPITIGIEVTITTDKMTDLYQIYGKLATQFQPYCTYSWYVPHKNIDKTDWEELTGKIEWDFSASFEVKDQLQETDREEYNCKMNFKITGWLFPNAKGCTSGIIYDIGTSTVFEAETFNRVLGLDEFTNPLMSAARKEGLTSYNNPREWNNGHPRIVNVFQTNKIGDKSINFILDKDRVFPFNLSEERYITLDGYNFENADILFVPRDVLHIKTDNEFVTRDYGGKANLFPMRNTMGSKKHVIEGYKMNVLSRSRNKVTVNFKGIDYHGNYDIVVADAVDWDSAEDRLKIGFTAK